MARTILAPAPTSRPNIYICCPRGRSGKNLDKHDKRPKFTLLLSIMCCSALHITLTGGLLADPGVKVQQFEGFKSLFLSSSPSLGPFKSLMLHLLLRICINFRIFSKNFARPPHGATYINCWLACRGCGLDGPIPGFLF